MNGRMELLGGVFGVMLVYVVGGRVAERVKDPLASSRDRTAKLNAGIAKQRKNVSILKDMTQYVPAWEARSLPPNREVARSLYQAWLLELVAHVDFEDRSVNSFEPVRRTHFDVLSFTVKGRGTLQQLTKFLFEFYQAVHLHKITSVGISPIPKSSQLKLSFSIEAIALKTAIDAEGKDRRAELSDVTWKWLSENNLVDPADLGDTNRPATLQDYDVIAERNLFDVGGAIDATDHTYFEGVVAADDHNEAWFRLRSVGVGSNEEIMVRHAGSDAWIALNAPQAPGASQSSNLPQNLKLRAGDSFRIGTFRATVEAIEDSDVILESEGARWLLTIGKSITDALALPPEF